MNVLLRVPQHSMLRAGMSAERAAALQRAQKNSAPHFVTKRVADPNMIPMLVAAGVEFGAVKVRSLVPSTLFLCVSMLLHAELSESLHSLHLHHS